MEESLNPIFELAFGFAVKHYARHEPKPGRLLVVAPVARDKFVLTKYLRPDTYDDLVLFHVQGDTLHIVRGRSAWYETYNDPAQSFNLSDPGHNLERLVARAIDEAIYMDTYPGSGGPYGFMGSHFRYFRYLKFETPCDGNAKWIHFNLDGEWEITKGE